MEARFNPVVAVVFFACCNYSVVAQTRPFSTEIIADEISGPGAAAQRRHVANLLGFLVAASEQPQRLTIKNVAALEGTDYEEPFCLTRPDGIRRCVYTYTSSEFVARLNHLDTFTLKDESDSGARVSMELNPDVVCLKPHTLSKLWGMPPVERPMPLQDFFAGSQDTEEQSQVSRQRYNDIVSSKPYIFVETHSVRGCVSYLHLYAIPPQLYKGDICQSVPQLTLQVHRSVQTS